MKILYVADGRSPIALNWIRYFVEHGHQVHLVSTFPSQPDLKVYSYHEVKVAFSGLKGRAGPGSSGPGKYFPVGLRTSMRRWIGPLTLGNSAWQLRQIIQDVQPDVIHAMRIPYEGMLASIAVRSTDHLLISVWGNDFTLHAPATPLMRYYTHKSLQRANALHTDCIRDLRLAKAWGYAAQKLSIVLPGAGGVHTDVFYPPPNPGERLQLPVVINPRGLRAYVRNDTFFKALPLLLMQHPETRFLCTGMAGEPEAEHWLSDLNLKAEVALLPLQPHASMADLFRQACIAVSPSTHDGTPNTLLEAMACGCFPIAGDIESLHEWIEPGLNGYLVDPASPAGLARAIQLAIEQPALRERAAEYNLQLILERAEYGRVMDQAADFYRQVASDQI